MGAKEILFHDSARAALLEGAGILNECVKVTLGPSGKNVMLDRNFGAPVVTKDGVTVAQEVELARKAQNLGAQLVKEVSSKTNEDAGDGTTTATLLAHSILIEGAKFIAAGHNPIDLKKGIQKALEYTVTQLQKLSRPISNPKEIEQIATISANNDPDIGRLISQAIEKSGKDGVVTIEEGKSAETSLEIVEGLEFDRGYLSPYFINQKEKLECQLENAHVLMTDKKISSLKDLLPVLEQILQFRKPLLIIADDVEGEALAGLVVNRLRGVLDVVAVKAPEFGDRKKAQLEDIAVVTGGQLISEDTGASLSSFDVSYLGSVKKVLVDKDNTILVGGGGSREAVGARLQHLRNEVKRAANDYDKTKLQERIAKLAGGVAVISVGGPTEIEMKEKKFRVEDALNATRAAVEEGVVPGGGTALLRVSDTLKSLKLEGAENFGAQLLQKALSGPIRQIASNSEVEPSVVVDRVLTSKNINFGFNALHHKYEDMVEAGILDPTKVVRSALQNAVSVAALMLTTEAVITEKPKAKKPVVDDLGPGGPTLL